MEAIKLLQKLAAKSKKRGGFRNVKVIVFEGGEMNILLDDKLIISLFDASQLEESVENYLRNNDL